MAIRFLLYLAILIPLLFFLSFQTSFENAAVKILTGKNFYAQGFDFPVGIPHAKGYYNAQKFKRRNKNFSNQFHLGEDWNGNGGGNSDFNDNVYSIGNGIVVSAQEEGRGWGKVIRIIHVYRKGSSKVFIESVYAHVHKMIVKKHDLVKKGQKIATIGNANGLYLAHLHLEIRSDITLPLGGGYSNDTTGFLNPTEFIKGHRKIK